MNNSTKLKSNCKSCKYDEKENYISLRCVRAKKMNL